MGQLFTGVFEDTHFEFEGEMHSRAMIEISIDVTGVDLEDYADLGDWIQAEFFQMTDARSNEFNCDEYRQFHMLYLTRRVEYMNGHDVDTLCFPVSDLKDAIKLFKDIDYSRPYYRILETTYDTTVETFNERV